MKNKIYYLGLAAALLITAGCMFKIMYWPGAGLGIALGMVILCFAFIPAAFISSYFSGNNKSQKFFYIITAMVFIINFISALFKIMHWPGANLLLIISLPLPFILILPVYLINNRDEKEINYKNFLAIVFFFAYFAAISALMALSVSRNVIEGYVQSAIRIEQETDVMTSQCHYLYSKIQADKNVEKTNLTAIQQAIDYSDKVCLEIDNLVKGLIMRQPQNKGNLFVENGKPDLWQIEFKEASIGIGIEDSLSVLKSDLNGFKDLLSKIKLKSNSSKLWEELVNTDENSDESWEYSFIKNKIVVSGIEKLYLLKHQVRLAEWEVMSLLE